MSHSLGVQGRDFLRWGLDGACCRSPLSRRPPRSWIASSSPTPASLRSQKSAVTQTAPSWPLPRTAAGSALRICYSNMVPFHIVPQLRCAGPLRGRRTAQPWLSFWQGRDGGDLPGCEKSDRGRKPGLQALLGERDLPAVSLTRWGGGRAHRGDVSSQAWRGDLPVRQAAGRVWFQARSSLGTKGLGSVLPKVPCVRPFLPRRPLIPR